MLYQFHFIYTTGINDTYETDIDVDLTDQEVQLIRSSISPESSTRVDEQLRRRLKKIYKKIIATGYPFCQYVSCHGIRLLDMGNDISWEPVDYDALLQEDIARGFVPHDNDGHPYIKEELLRQWVQWETLQLSDKPYPERVKYYEERYHFAVDGLLEKHLGSLHFTLPHDIDINCPTDNWWKRFLRRLH